MNDFFDFLLHTKKSTANLEEASNIHVVLGNESCDLDSTVSTLILAYSKFKQNCNMKNLLVLPILNLEYKYFNLRTEIVYVLNELRITPEMLIFKDNINFSVLSEKNIKVSLVDHHVFTDRIENFEFFENRVVEIFDHRPLDRKSFCKSDRLENTRIELCGSCATLIADNIMNFERLVLCEDLWWLLYMTIIYDTLGMNETTHKYSQIDVKILEKIKAELKNKNTNDMEIFKNLWRIHNDVSSISPQDILYRDLKFTCNIPIAGLPYLVQNYLDYASHRKILGEFVDENQVKGVVLMGMNAENEVKRDLGIYVNDEKFRDSLKDHLEVNLDKFEVLQLKEVYNNQIDLIVFNQLNVKLSRKYVLGLVKDIMESMRNN